MDLFASIENRFQRARCAGSFDAAMARWKRRHEILRRIEGLDELVALFRDPLVPAQSKDLVLRSLCAEAQRSSRGSFSRAGDENAALLLLWLHLPGLLEVARELSRSKALPAEELEVELLAGSWSAVAEVDGVVSKISARLINRARWHALAASRRTIAWESLVELVEPGSAAADREATLSWDPRMVLLEAVRRHVVAPKDVPLVLARPDELRNVARELGLSPRTAEQRRYRASLRLRAWFATFSDVPPGDLLA